MTYHDLSPELKEKVRANTIAEDIRDGATKKQAKQYLKYCIDKNLRLNFFFVFAISPEREDYWWDVMGGKIK